MALPALLASVLAGNSLLGQLAQIGIGFTANSALLKFSRTDEAEADYNGAEMMADAGYNPMELARFFERLEGQTGRQGGLVQFLSDHPNPGNRAEAIADEIRELPRRRYVVDETGQFVKIRELVRRLPAPRAAAKRRRCRPCGRESGLRTFAGATFSLAYPADWQVHGGARWATL